MTTRQLGWALALVSMSLVASPAGAQVVMRHGGGGQGGNADFLVLQELGVVVGVPEGSEEIRVMVLFPDRESDIDMEKDDLLLMLNGERVRDMDTLRAAYDSAVAGDEIKMGFRRGERRFLASFEKQDAPAGERRIVMIGGPGSDLGDLQPVHEFGVLLTEKEGEVVVAMQLPTDDPAFEEGDTVRSVNGQPVTSLAGFRAVYEPLAIGEDVEVVMVRDGDELRSVRAKAEFEGRVQVQERPLRSTGIALLVAVGIALIPIPCPSQSNPFNERDDQYRLLGLKRAKEAFEIAREDFERKESLLHQGVIPQNELDQARRALSEAEVNFQQSLLAVLFEQQYVAVLEAVKSQSPRGRKKVRVRLENTSGGGAEFRHLLPLEDELFRSLRPEIVHDVYVSLANEDGAIISQPYETKIEELRYGKPADLTFELLEDVDTVTVNLAYGQSSTRQVKIFLQKDATEDRVVVQSEQFAQELELGSSATFDLTLELFSGVSDTFKLQVVNLPSQINRYFLDPASQARLSQFKFTESGRTRDAALRVSLPDRPGEEVRMDRPIPFYVLAIPRQRADEIALPDPCTEAQIAALGVGFVRLELVPRGVGKLLVRVPQLFYSIKPGETAEVSLEVVNDGTRRLDNIEITAEPPHLWEKRIEPSMIAGLGVGREEKVTLRFDPPDGVTPGKYEVRIRSSSFSDDRPIQGEDKTLSVEIRPEVKVLVPTLLALALLGLVTGVVYTGVRLSRR